MISVGSIVKTVLKLKDGKDIHVEGEIIENHENTYKIKLISPCDCNGIEVFLLKNRPFEVSVA